MVSPADRLDRLGAVAEEPHRWSTAVAERAEERCRSSTGVRYGPRLNRCAKSAARTQSPKKVRESFRGSAESGNCPAGIARPALPEPLDPLTRGRGTVRTGNSDFSNSASLGPSYSGVGGALISDPQSYSDQEQRPQIVHAEYAQVIEKKCDSQSNQHNRADRGIVPRRRRWFNLQWRRRHRRIRSAVHYGWTGNWRVWFLQTKHLFPTQRIRWGDTTQ